MHVKTPVYCDKAYLEAKEEQLKEFIRSGISDDLGADRTLLLMVRSPECMAARILYEMSPALAAAGVRAQIIFAAGSAVVAGESWNLSFDPAFVHEARILRDVRFLDGHEQLVCGAGSVWFGDSMRREPDKRDAFSSFLPKNPELAGRARMTFARIWGTAEPVYAHDHPPYVAPDAAAAEAVPAPNLAASVAETLGDWSPSNRH